ncbi:unnamed protein product [Colias eurytheme]|nr:unnamed protein product [Colias eurytheme]
MPPKKCLKKRADVKQKRAIESRLMQLSLKTDDYIYKKKPISLEDAQNYKREINAFKETCRTDVRSMQVIEKLGRFLQKIIEEQTSTTPINKTAETYFDSNMIIQTSPSETQNNLKSPLASEITQDNEKATSSICNAPKITSDNTLTFNINDNFISNTNDIQEEQLNNIEITKFSTNLKMVNHSQTENINLTAAENDKINVSGKLNTENVMHNNNGSSYKIQEINNQPKENVTNNIKTMNDKQNTYNTVPVTIAPEVILHTDHNTQTVDDNNSYTVENNKRKKNSSNNINLSTCKKITTTNISPKKPNALYCNKKTKQTKTDLSWIDNIKYVREVNVDEYDPKLKDLSESFWNNCIFPSDWENEFVD